MTIDELVTGVDTALGTLGLASCPGLDTDLDGGVRVGEVVVAIQHARLGCPEDR